LVIIWIYPNPDKPELKIEDILSQFFCIESKEITFKDPKYKSLSCGKAGKPECYFMNQAFRDFSFKALSNKKSHPYLWVGMACA
jgi:hypothetical protein